MSEPSEPAPAHADDDNAESGVSLAGQWRALDRGWQALLLGLGIVAAHLVAQPF